MHGTTVKKKKKIEKLNGNLSMAPSVRCTDL